MPIKASFDYGYRLTDAGFAWTEYRGECGPPSYLGRTGDVWMNTKIGSMAIYWNLKGTWTPWAGLDHIKGNSPSSSRWILTPNPIIPTLFLWVRAEGVVWVPRSAILSDISRGNQPGNAYRHMSPLPVRAASFVSDFLTPAASRMIEKNRRFVMSRTLESGRGAERKKRSGDAICAAAPAAHRRPKVSTAVIKLD